MVLLLPMLLLTTSVQKLVGLDLALPGDGELPPELPGLVEGLEVHLDDGIVVRALIRRSDVVTSEGEVEERQVEVEDLASLQEALRSFKTLDPSHQRILVVPSDSVPTWKVVQTMDAVRGDSDGELFTEVALGGSL